MPLNSFEQAKLKIQWADHHIMEAERIIRSLPELYRMSIENYGEGRQAIKYEIPNAHKVGTDLALVIGDVFHNLRTALDYAWMGAIKRHAPALTEKRPQLPVFRSFEDLKDGLHKREIDTACPRLCEFLIFTIQPYLGGKDAIYRLHKLDISDKHHLLIPLMQVSAITDIALEDNEGNVEHCGPWIVTQPERPYLIPLQGNWKLKHKGHLSTAVIFDKGLLVEGMAVDRLLYSFAIETFAVVELFEHFY